MNNKTCPNNVSVSSLIREYNNVTFGEDVAVECVNSHLKIPIKNRKGNSSLNFLFSMLAVSLALLVGTYYITSNNPSYNDKNKDTAYNYQEVSQPVIDKDYGKVAGVSDSGESNGIEEPDYYGIKEEKVGYKSLVSVDDYDGIVSGEELYNSAVLGTSTTATHASIEDQNGGDRVEFGDDTYFYEDAQFDKKLNAKNLTVAEKAKVDGQLEVKDSAHFKDKLYVDDNLDLDGDINSEGELNVKDGITSEGELNVKDGANIKGLLNVLNKANIEGALNVSEDSVFENDALIKGNLTVSDTLFADDVNISGDFSLEKLKLNDGLNNILIGDNFPTNLTGSYNTFLGYSAGVSNTTGNNNLFIGPSAGTSNTIGNDNTFLGTDTGRSNQAGNANTFVGRAAGYLNENGNRNVYVGVESGRSAIGDYNTAVGYRTLYNDNSGGYNTAIGYQSLYYNSTGWGNVGSGYYALYDNTTGNSNVAIGMYAISRNQTGSENIVLGHSAGNHPVSPSTANNTNSNESIFIGGFTKPLNLDDTNEIVIGYGAEGAGSNSVVLGNNSILTTVLKGNVGIGTDSPTEKLDVDGGARFRSVGSGTYAYDLNLTSDGTLTTASSDIRLKEDIKQMDNTLDKVMQLDPVTFNWKDNPERGEDFGLIAQEVAKLFPELTFTNPNDGYMGVNYSRLAVILTKAIQEMQKEIDSKDAKLSDYEERLARLESLLCLDEDCTNLENNKEVGSVYDESDVLGVSAEDSYGIVPVSVQ